MIVDEYGLFAIIVETGSLSAAGRRLQMSPAMVSKRLARLEDRLGTRLIHRTTRRLALTEVGARFHADVCGVLDQVRRAEERVSGTVREPNGPLKVAMPTSFGRLHIAPRLHAFLAACPKIDLEVTLSDGFVDLMAERVDVAIRITADVPAGYGAVRLGASPRILCAAPAYLARWGTPGTLSDLASHRVLAADGQLPWRLLNGRRRASVDQPSHVRTNSSEVIRELAISGAGIALRSLWDVGAALRDGVLVRVLNQWQGSSDVAIYALHHNGHLAPAVTAFLAFLESSLDPPPWPNETGPTTTTRSTGS